MESGQELSFRAFINRHVVLTFYALVFAFVWGLPLVIIIIAGPGALLGTGDEPASAADLPPLMYLVSLAGPLCIALAGILVIALAFGWVGLREMRSRLLRWRVGVRWYAVALLTAPVVMTAILLTFSLTSQAFLPDIITTDDKASLLAAGLVAGLVAGFFEEIGWTGFATHELRKRHGVLATGLLVGLPWCLVHAPLYLSTDSGAVPLAIYVPVMAFSVLLPYRVLMVRVYDQTHSLLLSVLMHLTISASAFFLGSAAMVGMPDLIFNLVFGATLWVLVALGVRAERRRRSRPETKSFRTAAKYSSTHAA